MAMSGTGLMMGMAAGQALIQMLAGGGGGAAARGMMGGLGGRGGMMGGMTGMLGSMGSRGGMMGSRGGNSGGQSGLLEGGLEMMKQAGAGMKSAGARLQRAVCPPPAESFALVSRQPGRRRYRASFDQGLEESLEKLASLPFLKEVKANAVTGSILFTYEAAEANEEEMDKLAAALRERVFKVSLPPAPPAPPKGELPSEAHAGAITRSLRGTMRAFSAWIKERSGGWLDISSAASLFFLVRGFWKMMANQQYPTGSQMFWWAVSLMRGWRTV